MLQLTIIGNLGADAEVKEVNGKKFVSFNVAHTERWVDDTGTIHESTQWVGCALSGDGGNLLQYLKRGTTIYAVGRLKTRVYSSEKARAMVAGLDLSVQHIELVGGKADEIPSRLYDREGKQVDVSKHYWTSQAPYYGQIVYDRSGSQYSVDTNGWVSVVQTQPTQSSDEAPAQASADAETTTEPTDNKKIIKESRA